MLEGNSINVHSSTRPQLALQKWEPAGRIGDFGHFFNGLAKSPRELRSSWILNECNLSCKIVKYSKNNCILSEACMVKQRLIVYCFSSDVMYKKYKRIVTRHQIGWQDFIKQTCRKQKTRPDLFSKNLFFRPNRLWSRAIMALKCDRRWLLFFGRT